MSIKECFKPTTNKTNSSKNPKFYNNEKKLCISEGALNEVKEVRKYFAESSHTPTNVLVTMLENEQDKDILRIVLLNSRLPRKAVAKFVNSADERVDFFEEDEEIIAHFTQE